VKFWRLLAAVIAAVTCVVACEQLLDLREPNQFSAADAGVDALPVEAASDAFPPDPCAAGPELPPATGLDDDPDTELPPQAFVVWRFRFDTDGGVAGFNLDNECRCAGSGVPPCVPRGDKADVLCDGDGGVDNALAIVSRTTLFKDKQADEVVTTGTRALLLVLSGYNGRLNDRSVRVSLGGTPGLYSDKGCDGKPRGRVPMGTDNSGTREADGGPSPTTFTPTWDGCDEWYVARGDIDPKTGDFLRGVTGYVTNGQLVVVDGKSAPFFAGEFRFDLLNPKLRARIVLPDGGFIPDGGIVADGGPMFALREMTVAGAAGLGDLIRSLGTVSTSTVGGFVCNVPPLYQAGIDLICQGADLPTDPSRLRQGDSCSTLSMGAVAVGDPVRMEVSDRFIFVEQGGCGAALRDERACPGDAGP